MSPFYWSELICVIAWDFTGGADRQIWVVSHHARPAAASSAAVVWWQVETHPASSPNEVLWSGWVGLPWKHIPTHFIFDETVILENKHQSITECFCISNLKRFIFFPATSHSFHLVIFDSGYFVPLDLMCAVRCHLYIFETMGLQTRGAELHYGESATYWFRASLATIDLCFLVETTIEMHKSIKSMKGNGDYLASFSR